MFFVFYVLQFLSSFFVCSSGSSQSLDCVRLFGVQLLKYFSHGHLTPTVTKRWKANLQNTTPFHLHSKLVTVSFFTRFGDMFIWIITRKPCFRFKSQANNLLQKLMETRFVDNSEAKLNLKDAQFVYTRVYEF